MYHVQVAYRMLANENPDVKVLIKPIGSCGHGTFAPSSAEELRFYDFPYGDVVLQVLMTEEGGEGARLSPSLQYFSQRLLEGKICERIVMGSTTYGLRSCSADPAFVDDIIEKSQQLLGVLKPQGAGGFAYIAHDGQPLLTDMHVQSGIEHFTKLFHDMYGNNKPFASWSFCPNASLDIWTLWTRLCDGNIAFSPASPGSGLPWLFPTAYRSSLSSAQHRRSFHPPQRRLPPQACVCVLRCPASSLEADAWQARPGVFPLLFLKGTTATLIAIGDTEAQVSDLRVKADLCVRLVEEMPRMESVALCESRNRVGPCPSIICFAYGRRCRYVGLPLSSCIPPSCSCAPEL